MRYQQQTPQQDPMQPVQHMPPRHYPQGMMPPQGMPPQQGAPHPVPPSDMQPPMSGTQPAPQGTYVQPQVMQQTGPQQPVMPQSQSAQQMAVTPTGEGIVPLDRGYRRVAAAYFRDTWQMLLAVLGALLIIFVAVRMATRGYLWGLIFVLIAALAGEASALRLLPAWMTDVVGGRMLVRTVLLKGVAVQSPSLLERTGLSNKARYALLDDQDRRYFFTADKGLQQNFSELEDAEVEIAFLERSSLMTGIHPVRCTEYLSVMESARERRLCQVFKAYLP